MSALTETIAREAYALSTAKPPVRVVSTTQRDLSGLPSIDGITVADGDSVLLTGQTAGEQNGPWVVYAAGWVRRNDLQRSSQAQIGSEWTVTEGSRARTKWLLSGPTGAIVLNTTPLVFTEFAPAPASSAADTTARLSARIATTANHGLTGLAAIDGVTPNVGDRVLVTAQTTQSQNGLYVAAAGAWARAGDADSAAELPYGMRVDVREGTSNRGSTWVHVTAGAVTLGVTALRFIRERTEIDVRETGAVGDGTTDDSAAINAAILAVAARGGHVRLPSGTYRAAAPIVVANNVTFSGDGSTHIAGSDSIAATVIVDGRANPSTPLITFGPNDGGGLPTSRGCIVQDLKFSFPATAKTGYGIDCTGTTGITFRNVKFEGATSGGGVPVSGGSDPGLIYLEANEAVTFEDCTFQYGSRQVVIAGTGAGGPYSLVRAWFYDCNAEHIACLSNGDHDIRLESCAFDSLYRTTIPSLGVDLRANGFEIVNCSFYGVLTKAPTGTYLSITGTGSIRGCAFHSLSTAITVDSANVDISGNAFWAYNAINIKGGVVTGGGNSYTPAQVVDNVIPISTGAYDVKRAVLVAEPYVTLTSVDLGPDTFRIDQAATTTAVTGATNATPIVVTSVAHGLANRALATIAGVGGNTAANGTWRVQNVTANTFEVVDPLTNASVAGNGAYTSGGTVRRVWHWIESYRVGNATHAAGYKQFVTGVIHYDGAQDQSIGRVTLGNLVTLDKVNAQQVSAGNGTVLTHAQCGDVITSENYVSAVSYSLPPIRAGLEYTFLKRPDVVSADNPSASMTIAASGADRIFVEGAKDGVASIVNADVSAYNATITLRGCYWYDSVAAADKLRWIVVRQTGNWTGVGAAASVLVSSPTPTSSATPQTLLSRTVPDNSVIRVSAAVVARKPSDDSSASYRRTAIVKRAGGGATLIGAVLVPEADAEDAGAAAWDVTIDVSGNDVRLRVTGDAGIVYWQGRLEALAELVWT